MIMLYLTDQGLKGPTEKEISKSNGTINRKTKSLHTVTFFFLMFFSFSHQTCCCT